MRIPLAFAVAAIALFAAALLGPGLPGQEGRPGPGPELMTGLIAIEYLFLSWLAFLAPPGGEVRAAAACFALGIPAAAAAAPLAGWAPGRLLAAEGLLLLGVLSTAAWSAAARALGRDLGPSRAAVLFLAQAGPFAAAFLMESALRSSGAGLPDPDLVRAVSPYEGIRAAASGSAACLAPLLFVQGLTIAVPLLALAFARPAAAGSR